MLPSLPSHHDFQWCSALVHLGTRLDSKVPSFSWTTLQGSCSLWRTKLPPGCIRISLQALLWTSLVNDILSVRELMRKRRWREKGLGCPVLQMPLRRGRGMGERSQRKV